MDRQLPNYPQWELMRAGRAFAESWGRTLINMSTKPSTQRWTTRDVRRLDRLHKRHPGDVFMVNCEEYLFPPIDYPPVSLLIPTSSRERVKRGRESDPDSQESELKSKRGRFEEASPSGVIYRCDVCDDAGALGDVNEAYRHLRETGHSSCSRYELFKVKFGGDAGEEATSELLYSPRCILPPNDTKAQYGWNDGDAVVFCPQCHLVFPDKLVCVRHFEEEHNSEQRVYCISRVLKGCRFNVDLRDPVCSGCSARLPDLNSLCQHWLSESSQCSPFQLLNSTPGCGLILMGFQCGTCKRLRDELVPENEVSNEAFKPFIRSVLSHVKDGHAGDEKGVILFRFVDVSERHRSMLPSCSRELEFVSKLEDTERYAKFVKKFRGQRQRFCFFKNVKAVLKQLKGKSNKSETRM